MSKYVIEIEEKPLCVFDKDTQTFFPRLWRVKGFNSLVLDEEGLSRLEELNSDYINEHFGDLQDTAYQRGFEDGKKEAESSEAIEQVKKDAFNKGMLFKEEKIHDAFLRGVEKGKAVLEKGCEGCKYKGTIGMPPCIHCCNNFPNAWKKQDDKPIIGEVVERYLNGKRDGVGMFLGEDGDYWNCLFWTGAIFGTFAYPSNQFKRTGNVCDIIKILEAMKHD